MPKLAVTARRSADMLCADKADLILYGKIVGHSPVLGNKRENVERVADRVLVQKFDVGC